MSPDLSLVPVACGQRWAVPKTPFDGHYPPVEIIETRAGHVRYAFADGSDHVMAEPTFRAIYVPVRA